MNESDLCAEAMNAPIINYKSIFLPLIVNYNDNRSAKALYLCKKYMPL